MAEVNVSYDVIPVAELESRVADISHGAICVFLGQTRNHARGREVAQLIYRAYIPMAERQLLQIAEAAEARWKCQVVIHHRLGEVLPGQVSVAVVVGSPHRAEAFEACRYCIDTLKQNVPIWKKEVCPDGTFWIEGEEAVASTHESS